MSDSLWTKGCIVENPSDRDLHFTDFKTLDSDRRLGSEIAYRVGDTYIDYMGQSPVEQWTEIVKALRIHSIRSK